MTCKFFLVIFYTCKYMEIPVKKRAFVKTCKINVKNVCKKIVLVNACKQYGNFFVDFFCYMETPVKKDCICKSIYLVSKYY